MSAAAREVWLTTFGDDGKVNEKLLYTSDMKYKGNNVFFKEAISVLNKMNTVDIGSTVLVSLTSSKNKYYYTNQIHPDGSNATTVPTEGKGTYFLMGRDMSLENTAHELFHGYQIEQGVGGKSIVNEVDSYLYGYAVAYNYALDNYLDSGSQKYLNIQDIGRNNVKGGLYNDAFMNVLTSKNNSAFNNFSLAIMNFKQGALSNINGYYNEYPMRVNKKNTGLVWKFAPLIKYAN